MKNNDKINLKSIAHRLLFGRSAIINAQIYYRLSIILLMIRW